MKKKLMALFLCALMIASLLPGSVIADTAASVKFGDHVTAKDNNPDETKTEITKWVSRHEDASGNFDGTYDITIESYAHAYYKPVDVVLVVDQSGSMTENYDKEHRKTNLAHLIDGLKELGDDLKDVDMANRVAVIGFSVGT